MHENCNILGKRLNWKQALNFCLAMYCISNANNQNSKYSKDFKYPSIRVLANHTE